MDPDEMMKAIEQVATRTEQDRKRVEIEAYINKVCASVGSYVNNTLGGNCFGIPKPTHSQISTWVDQNRECVSIQASEVVRIILRKELLGE